MSNIETLLRHREDGTITSEELEQLNLLTHRDTVLNNATMKAKRIRRKRNTCLTAAVAVVAVIGILTTTQQNLPYNTGDTPLVAQNTIKPNQQPDVITSVKQDLNVQSVAIKQNKHTIKSDDSASETNQGMPQESEQPLIESVVTTEATQPTTFETEPVVACNTQCSPDSVINDIWKFLRA